MAIDKKKILTMSASDYCKREQKDLWDYEAEGVHFSWDGEGEIDFLKMFSGAVPNDVEAVTEYRFSLGVRTGPISASLYFIGAGTALRPVKNKEKEDLPSMVRPMKGAGN